MGQPSRIRVVCSSRNLTTSSTWEVFASFDGSEDVKPASTGLGPKVADFLHRLRREFSHDGAFPARRAAPPARCVFPTKPPAGPSPGFCWQWRGGGSRGK